MRIQAIELTGHMLCVPMTAIITYEQANMLRVCVRPTMIMDTPVGKHYMGDLVDSSNPSNLWREAWRLHWALDDTKGDSLDAHEMASDYMSVLRQFGAREEATHDTNRI